MTEDALLVVVRFGSAAVMVIGVVLLLRARRSERTEALRGALGAFLATFGAASFWRAMATRSATGDPVWTSLRDLYRGTFDSWSIVVAVAAGAAALWVAVASLGGVWSMRRSAAIVIGSLQATGALGALDSTI